MSAENKAGIAGSTLCFPFTVSTIPNLSNGIRHCLYLQKLVCKMVNNRFSARVSETLFLRTLIEYHGSTRPQILLLAALSHG